jgi:hypothetical protein
MGVEWKAFYNDNTSLPQFNADRSENRYIDIDRSKLVKFVLYQNNLQKVVVHLDSNKKLVYRRRVAISATSQIKQEIWLVGWQEKISGRNIQQLIFLFDDGHIEVIDRFREEHPFDEIIFIEEEKPDA